MSQLRHLALATLLMTTSVWGTNVPGVTCTGSQPEEESLVDETVDDPMCDKCGVQVSCASLKSLEWDVNIGLARYKKPANFTALGQSAYEFNGNLPTFKQLYSRYFSDSPMQQMQVNLYLSQTKLSEATFHPSCLFLQSEANFITLTKPAANGRAAYNHQIVTDDRFTLINILPEPEIGWRVRVWKKDAIYPNTLTLLPNSIYYDTTLFEELDNLGKPKIPALTDATFKCGTNDEGSPDYNQLLYILREHTGAATRSTTTEIVQELINGKPHEVVSKSYFGEGTGGPQLSEQILTYSDHGPKAWDYTIVREIKTASVDESGTMGNLVLTAKTKEQYQDFSPDAAGPGGHLGMKRLVKRIDAYDIQGQTPQTTEYTYKSAPGNSAVHGRLLTATKPDGSWISYDYSASVAGVPVVKEYSSWKNIGMVNKESARLTETIVNNHTTTVVNKINNVIVAASSTTLAVTSGEPTTTTRKWDGIGSINEPETWPNITTTAYNPDSNNNNPITNPSTGRIKWVERPDGTATTYEYTIDGLNNLQVIESTGAGSRTGITAGTRVTTTYTIGNIPIAHESKDIATGLIIEHWVADSTAGSDATGRPVKRIYNADVDDFDITRYGCCGLDEFRARDGSIITYSRDKLKRLYKTEFRATSESPTQVYPVVTTFTKYEGLTNNHGLTTTRTRRVGNSSSLFIGSTTRSLDGLTTITVEPARKSNAVADRVTTTTATARSVTGDIVTTTHADNSTTITAHYLDGQIKAVDGSAVPDKQYDYGTHNENGGGLTSTVTASGVSTVTFTDPLGLTTKTVSPATGTTTYAYHPANAAAGSRGKLQSVTDGDGVTVTYSYNGEGERSTTSHSIPVAGNTAATQVTTVGNDVVSDITLHGQTLGVSFRQTQTISSTDVAPITISESYRTRDGLITASRSLGRDTVTITTRPNSSGVVTRTTIHPDGTKTVETLTHGLTTRVEKRDTADSVISATDYGHDAHQRLETVTDSRTGTAGKTTYSDFTESGQPLTTTQGTTAPNIRVTSLVKDILGRTTATTLPDESVAYTSYWPTGQVRAQWGSQTNPVFHVYDEQNRLIELHTWQTSPALTLTTVVPPAGSAKTEWQYSTTTGRLDRKQYADGNGTNYTYTNAGRLETRAWERGITTTYGYTHGLLTSTDYSDSTPDVAITYDALGRQQSISNGLANSTFDYDDATDLGIDTETITYTLPGQSPFERVLDRRARSYGRDTGWQLKNGGTIENEALYTWSATHGRITSISNPQSSNVSFSYDYVAGSSLIENITGPAHTVTNTWDPTRDALLVKDNRLDGALNPVSQYAYTVNSLGQREKVETVGTAFGVAPVWNWSYNPRGELVSARDTSANSRDLGYIYDAIGNRVATGNVYSVVNGTEQVTNPVAYTANALNQYTLANGVSLPTTPAPAPHDLDGNLRFDGGVNKDNQAREYLWDAENRLTAVKRVSDSATVVSFLYDAQSRRIAKKAGHATTLYVYDLFNCIAEYSWSADLQSASLTKTRLWGIDLSGTLQGAGGVGGLLAEKQGANTFYPTYDGNGNISEYLAADGTVAAHFEYDPFGNTVVNTDSSGQFSYRFSTKPLDSETGLYYYQYRYLNPVTGRWPSRDPIEEEGGANLYGFVGNGPVSRVDYLGLSCVPWFSERVYEDVFIRWEEGPWQSVDDLWNDLLERAGLPSTSKTLWVHEQFRLKIIRRTEYLIEKELCCECDSGGYFTPPSISCEVREKSKEIVNGPREVKDNESLQGRARFVIVGVGTITTGWEDMH